MNSITFLSSWIQSLSSVMKHLIFIQVYTTVYPLYFVILIINKQNKAHYLSFSLYYSEYFLSILDILLKQDNILKLFVGTETRVMTRLMCCLFPGLGWANVKCCQHIRVWLWLTTLSLLTCSLLLPNSLFISTNCPDMHPNI